MSDRNEVVLVDVNGIVQGQASKLGAHQAGQLHLAFSVVLYRESGEILLQQRVAGKYHFPGYWANACCSHPAPFEATTVLESATSRVDEELGMTVTLQPAGTFIYRATCPSSGLIEHELDHVFITVSEEMPVPDPTEVAGVRWVDPQAVLESSLKLPMAPWLAQAVRLAEAARAAG